MHCRVGTFACHCHALRVTTPATHKVQEGWSCYPSPTCLFGFLDRHVLIAVSLLYCFPLVMYFDVTYEMPAFKPKLGYWPSDSWPIVVPYIALEDPHKQC